MLHHPVRPRPVRAGVLQRQRLRIGQPDRNLRHGRDPPPCLLDHPRLGVDSGDPTRGTHRFGHRGQVGAGTAADIRHGQAGPQIQPGQHVPFVVAPGFGHASVIVDFARSRNSESLGHVFE
ncbi:hypothetical protein A4R44_00957 [Amycolatopsis sp. M39]|nr:hypothetical protein A4R44_00957 [Amycolatopsis sp. M39]